MENFYLDAPAFAAWNAQAYGNVLGIVRFAGDAQALPQHTEIPFLHVPAKPLDSRYAVYEIWRSDTPPGYGCQDAIHYSVTDSLLWGCLSLSESAGLQQTTQSAYDRILRLLEQQGMPHFYRVWHYIPAINQLENGTERYRLFNQGRQAALQATGLPVQHSAAASAVGANADAEFCICFLAGRQSALPVENPRQVSAYHYPPQYGASPPLFSRAGLIQADGQSILFISGTASIVGHRSLHAGDVRAQTRETLANLSALLEAANQQVAGARFSLAELEFKVYLRHAEDAVAVAEELCRLVGKPVAMQLLQSAICRPELLVEIEAVARWGSGHAQSE
jgi:chorismate lyase/3-hydroxybenzoate synthase